MALPKNSISSMVQYFQQMRIPNKDERALLIRLGTLVDALIQQDKGLANVGAEIDKRQLDASVPAPTGTVTQITGAIHLAIDKIDYNDLGFYEMEISKDSGYIDPVTKTSYTTHIVERGLDTDTPYYIRIRAVSKKGLNSAWAELGVTTVRGSDAVMHTDNELHGAGVSITVDVGSELVAGGAESFQSDTETLEMTEDTVVVNSITIDPPDGIDTDHDDSTVTCYFYESYTATTAGAFTYDLDGTDKFYEGISKF